MRNQLPQNFSIPTLVIAFASTLLFGALVLSGATNDIAFKAMLASGAITASILLVELFRK